MPNTYGQVAHLRQRSAGSCSTDKQSLPIPHTQWRGKDEDKGYLGTMCTGVNSPNGFVLGRIALSKIGDLLTLSGDSDGLSIVNSSTSADDIGKIVVSDNSLLTTAGTRLLTITRNNTETTTVPITIYDDNSDVCFYANDGDDNNDGRQPHKPRRTLVKAYDISIIRQKTLYKRGDIFNGTICLTTGRAHGCYGDPMSSRPRVVYDPNFSQQVSTLYNNGVTLTYDKVAQSRRRDDDSLHLRINNFTLSDITLDANSTAYRIISVPDCNNYNFIRFDVVNNADHWSSAGLRFFSPTDGGVVKFMRSKNVYGDGIYCTKLRTITKPHEFAYCDIDTPLGSSADCIQVTDEGRVDRLNRDLWIHDCRLTYSSSSNTTKGAIATEGIDGYLIENNVIDGRYFGITLGGKNGTCRGNKLLKGGLNTGAKYFTWGIGIGTSEEVSNISIYNNSIVGTDYNTDERINDGIVITGSDNTYDRPDLDIVHNVVKHCRYSIRAKNVINWSGSIHENLAEGNVTSDQAIDAAGQATSGDSQTKTVVNTLIGHFESNSVTSIAGTVIDNNTMIATTDLANDEQLLEHVWTVDGIPTHVGDTFTVPIGMSTSTTARRPQFDDMRTSEISVTAKVTKDSKFDYVHSSYSTSIQSSGFYGGTKTGIQSSAGTAFRLKRTNGSTATSSQLSAASVNTINTASGNSQSLVQTSLANVSIASTTAGMTTRVPPAVSASVGLTYNVNGESNTEGQLSSALSEVIIVGQALSESSQQSAAGIGENVEPVFVSTGSTQSKLKLVVSTADTGYSSNGAVIGNEAHTTGSVSVRGEGEAVSKANAQVLVGQGRVAQNYVVSGATVKIKSRVAGHASSQKVVITASGGSTANNKLTSSQSTVFYTSFGAAGNTTAQIIANASILNVVDGGTLKRSQQAAGVIRSVQTYMVQGGSTSILQAAKGSIRSFTQGATDDIHTVYVTLEQ